MTARQLESVNEDVAYPYFCKYLEQKTGISLGDNKAYLVKSKLAAIMREYKMSSLAEMLALLTSAHNPQIEKQVIDVMTTNETFWFRDDYPFEYLKQHNFPNAISDKSPLRILSAACSYGHEPYSISIAAEEFLENNPAGLSAEVEIVATDISTHALEKARKGLYDEYDIKRGLSNERCRKYFDEVDDSVQIKNKIRRRVSFRKMNLVQDLLPTGRFDIIFCRNVLIYFSRKNKINILDNIADALVPRGYLFLGASEPLASYSSKFSMCHSPRGVVYQLS